jgi:hypothetical protein
MVVAIPVEARLLTFSLSFYNVKAQARKHVGAATENVTPHIMHTYTHSFTLSLSLSHTHTHTHTHT